MDIDVIFSAAEVTHERVKGRVAVVIDVLRATTVMVTALHNGALGIWPVLSPGEGFEMKQMAMQGALLLGGERNAEKIPGFDLGNSPLDYTREKVHGKKIALTTTNGTRALRASLEADELYVAAFSNASATASHLIHHPHITLICSGSNNLFTIEDALCAGYLIRLLADKTPEATLSDAALAVNLLCGEEPDGYQKTASAGRHYNLLKMKGFLADLDYCFEKDILPTVCRWEGRQKGIVKV